MQAHLDNTCLSAPDNAKSSIKKKTNAPSVAKTKTSIFKNSTIPRVQRQSKTIPIINFIDHVNEEEQETLEFIKLAEELLDKVYDEVKIETNRQISKAQ
ncbi:9870_t:CDS:2, partial [Racocetra fulgida]